VAMTAGVQNYMAPYHAMVCTVDQPVPLPAWVETARVSVTSRLAALIKPKLSRVGGPAESEALNRY